MIGDILSAGPGTVEKTKDETTSDVARIGGEKAFPLISLTADRAMTDGIRNGENKRTGGTTNHTGQQPAAFLME